MACIKCPAGFYCAGSVDADTGHVSGTCTPMLCPKGHYCPPGRLQYRSNSDILIKRYDVIRSCNHMNIWMKVMHIDELE